MGLLYAVYVVLQYTKYCSKRTLHILPLTTRATTQRSAFQADVIVVNITVNIEAADMNTLQTNFKLKVFPSQLKYFLELDTNAARTKTQPKMAAAVLRLSDWTLHTPHPSPISAACTYKGM